MLFSDFFQAILSLTFFSSLFSSPLFSSRPSFDVEENKNKSDYKKMRRLVARTFFDFEKQFYRPRDRHTEYSFLQSVYPLSLSLSSSHSLPTQFTQVQKAKYLLILFAFKLWKNVAYFSLIILLKPWEWIWADLLLCLGSVIIVNISGLIATFLAVFSLFFYNCKSVQKFHHWLMILSKFARLWLVGLLFRRGCMGGMRHVWHFNYIVTR